MARHRIYDFDGIGRPNIYEMKKNVVLINQSTGYLMIDIVNAYAVQYDQVALIAGSIKYSERSLADKVHIDKIVAYDRSSAIRRILTWLFGTMQILFKLIFKYRQYEVVYVTNPPMSYLLAYFIHRPYSIIVYDIYPDALKNIGITEHHPIYRLWAKWNKSLFAKAKKVITLSEGMGKVLELYVNRSQIKVIYNWSASDKLHPIEKTANPFAKQHELEDKFIILYSGNIGYTHNVECLVDIAEYLRNDPSILFLIIGEGKKKEMIQDMVSKAQLTSFLFLTWQNKDVLPYSLSAADVAVITLNDDTAQASVPSKTYNLLAVGAPLMCISPQNSELARLVNKFQNGSCFEKDETENMAVYISKLKAHPEIRKELSANSLLAAKSFTYQNAEEYV